MNNVINEQQLQIEVDQLKSQFPDTKDLYREVCVLLFFRYGITPTANKLYQYVRRGSMSAPADALNKFWLELREKSRVRIERTDIPENIRMAAGDFVATLWNDAQKAAQAGFSELVENATAEILKFKLETEIAKQDAAKIHQELNEILDKLENAIKRITEAEKIHTTDTSTLAAQEKTLKTLQNERDKLELSLEAARAGFSCNLDKMNVSLNKAEERYRMLEAKSLLEVDRTRQHASKLEKELTKLREATRSDQVIQQKELSSLQNTVTGQREKIGMLNGQLSMIVSQHKDTTKQLRLKERKLEMTTNKLLHLQSSKKKIMVIPPVK
ncbi:DNA-binding protein [Methylotenera sp.]|uniref:DNA-binding protein n=1 Tax=Methylotenera sp. TaxID=2051956 RepID=UPI002734500E|nr:DNA-binding protein [Methylotenera sp.]MDP3307104.1 DNA-binding protein [Methylotenera sp.]